MNEVLFDKILKSLFITGTDTDVGKTYITAGLAITLRKMNVDIGIMKPFAAGDKQKKGYKSEDVEILSNAAQINDPESLVNPQFFPISASPYTAWKKLKIKPKIPLILSSFKKLSDKHEMMLVEGMGGTMTPILKNYYVANLIKDMKIPTVIVTRSKVGTVNHTLMTVLMCQKYKIPIKGIIINNFDKGYPINQLKKDLESLTGIKVLGSIPFIKDMSDKSLYRIFKKNIDMKLLLK
tara:strand:- start:674 stop:1384 length:711 start_codon:yes stop_codon:yes gene_type:complete